MEELLALRSKKVSGEPISNLLLSAHSSKRLISPEDKLTKERFFFEKSSRDSVNTETYYCHTAHNQVPTQRSNPSAHFQFPDSDLSSSRTVSTIYNKPYALDRWKSISPVQRSHIESRRTGPSNRLAPIKDSSKRATKIRFIQSPRMLEASQTQRFFPTQREHIRSESMPKEHPFTKGRKGWVKENLSLVRELLHRKRKNDFNDILSGTDEFLKIFDAETLDRPRFEAIKILMDKMERERYSSDSGSVLKNELAIKNAEKTKHSKYLAEFEHDIKAKRRDQAPMRLTEVNSAKAGILDKIRKYVPLAIVQPARTSKKLVDRRKTSALYTEIVRSVDEIVKEQQEVSGLEGRKAYGGAFTRDFFYAVKQGEVEAVRLLLKKNHNLIHETDHVMQGAATLQVGQTALHIATRIGNQAMASMLLEQGADPNARDIV